MQIRYLNPDQQDVAVHVLSAAFAEYPVMTKVLDADNAAYPDRLKALVGFYTGLRFRRGWPVLGLEVDGEIRAVTLLNDPEDPDRPGESSWIEQEQEALEKLRQQLGDETYTRMEAFEQSSNGAQPEYPHFFIGMIGVLPAYQGCGYAGALIRHVKTLSQRHPASRAVVLTTESEKNLTFYSKQGFTLVSEDWAGEIHSRCFACPTESV